MGTKQIIMSRYDNFSDWVDAQEEHDPDEYWDETGEAEWEDERSECCGAEIYEDTDICSQCREHV